MEEVIVDIGEIGNYYGGLRLKEQIDGSFHWSIENWDGEHWQEIPDYLAKSLLQFAAESAIPKGVDL